MPRVSDGRTHYEGCEQGHHDCALVRLELERAAHQDILAVLAELAGVLGGNPIAEAVGVVDGVKHEIAMRVKAENDLRDARAEVARLREALESCPILIREAGEYGRPWLPTDRVWTTFGQWDEWYKKRDLALAATAKKDKP